MGFFSNFACCVAYSSKERCRLYHFASILIAVCPFSIQRISLNLSLFKNFEINLLLVAVSKQLRVCRCVPSQIEYKANLSRLNIMDFKYVTQLELEFYASFLFPKLRSQLRAMKIDSEAWIEKESRQPLIQWL